MSDLEAEARKVGRALARNRLLIVLPSHSDGGADGVLTGRADERYSRLDGPPCPTSNSADHANRPS
ncbi:hypothetical protein [Rhodococcus opacus]|jgi:O6-methylguanine-DNA--protein-cysteine methyltransferase|uniref:hypothetical protein n=1 Tax=Rhodococcus opacus TaxID=37919 RepID=UPI000EA8A733|nr:hypothetical protein [Rhodococcus opacus]QZS52676.1 hypothetical protein FXW36_00295 [Rhodococcus opacus]RKM65324.1 hypothetical protein COO55_41090 [Rhodococcus opacus]